MTILHLISILAVLSALISFVVITIDLRSHPQPMKIMRPVWMLTGLWAGLFGLWAYFSFGRAKNNTSSPTPSVSAPTSSGMSMPGTMKMSGMQNMQTMPDMPGMKMKEMPMPPEKTERPASMPGMEMKGMQGMQMEMGARRPHWQTIALSTLHCGAGCTLADLTGEWITSIVPVAIGGSMIAGSWVLDYVLALFFGVWFQYFAIRSMQAVPAGEAVKRAVKADFLSLTAWQAGMYGWMALVYFVFFTTSTLGKDTWTFWFMMQIAMGFGFLFAYPMNALLIRTGIKKGM